MTKSLHPAVRITTVVAVVAVALIAAIVSYSHMQQLAYAVGESWRSWLIPISIDGLVVAASMTLLTRHRAGLPISYLGWSALGGGVIASITANMADARPQITAILLAGWAPVAFAIGFELLLLQRRAENVVSMTDLGSQATASTPPPPTAIPALSPPRPPEPTPTAARPVSAEQPAIAPLPPPQPTVAPRPVPVPTVSPAKRSPRIGAAPTAPGRAFPQPLKDWEIQAIYNGLDKKLPYWQIAESVGRSTSVVNKYAAERRKQLAQARNGNGRVSQR